MLQELFAHSTDLTKLRDEGYNMEVAASHLHVHDIPYLNAQKTIARGTLVTPLDINAGRTIQPASHVSFFVGDAPCDVNGVPLNGVIISSNRSQPYPNLWVDHTLSAKPLCGYYTNYYEKVSAYVRLISHPAAAIDPTATACLFRPFLCEDPSSPFVYEDSASTRARIMVAAAKLKTESVAIIGLGGTGSYVLDLIAKAPINCIHLYDGDLFLQHNAFRSPGAASFQTLEEQPYKTDHLKQIYSNMHRGIQSHPVNVSQLNIHEFRDVDFVFICVDRGDVKEMICKSLESYGISFIDVGMGLYLNETAYCIGGILRTTTSTPANRNHFPLRVDFSTKTEEDDYDRNIQIADLNALNASLAVIKWKKLRGFYLDLACEHHSTYIVNGKLIDNEDES